MTDRDPMILPGMFGRKFIIFSIVVIAATALAVTFFDNTNDEDMDLMNPYQHMQKEQGPYRAVNPVVPGTAVDTADTMTAE